MLDGGLTGYGNFYKLIENYSNISITFIDFRGQFIAGSETRHISRAAYYRLAVLHLFEGFERVAYIDADSFVLDDIYNLYNENIGDKMIAACLDAINWQKACKNHKVNFDRFSGTYEQYQLTLPQSTKCLARCLIFPP